MQALQILSQVLTTSKTRTLATFIRKKRITKSEGPLILRHCYGTPGSAPGTQALRAVMLMNQLQVK